MKNSKFTRTDTSRHIASPTGTDLSCKSWLTEAPFRMLQNNLHPDVAENPQSLVVYGGIGRAARNWECYDQLLESLKELEDDQTLLVQSGKPVGVFQSHEDAQRVSGQLVSRQMVEIAPDGNARGAVSGDLVVANPLGMTYGKPSWPATGA